MIERDAGAVFDREVWLQCAAFGIQGLPVPVEYGGPGADLTTTILAMEALGHGCRDNGLVFTLNAQMWACQMPILHYGSEEQKREYLPGRLLGRAHRRPRDHRARRRLRR